MKAKNKALLFGISTLTLMGVLVGCGKEDAPTLSHLTYGHIYKDNIKSITELDELQYDGLVSKIGHQESFILALYNPTCDCWTDFGPILTEFINTRHFNVEYMDVTSVMYKDEKYGLHTVKGDMPSIAIFSKGKLLDQRVYGLHDTKIFRDITYLNQYIDSKCYAPKMYYIEKDALDGYISSNKTFNLYIARSECPDCQKVDTDVLRAWNEEVTTVSSPLYIFDIQKWHPGMRPVAPTDPGEEASQEEKQKYQEDLAKYEADLEIYNGKNTEYKAIKDAYGLSETEANPILGFGEGVVPTLQRREGSNIKDMIAILNDSIDRDNNKIISYFTTERIEKMPFLSGTTLTVNLNGMSLTDDQIVNWRSYKHTYNQTYHYPIVKAFISSYIK